ncbi:MAG: 23S rRNA (adenine(2503)-C(2))-methyltransferase RlmN, partial [Muribaculaceae bacterium]|nr:23S rRNA (adenine(2503)-C(2))-methyltransferase RlmN [Muribaculaceae bacterium]
MDTKAAKTKRPLIGMTLSELEGVVKEGGMPRFVAKQIAQWLYEKKVTSFDEMANISKKNKQWLEEYYVIGREEPVSNLKSEDGTVKYLFNVGDGKKIESVYIPDKDRATLCVSSQVGCRMNCYFCMTGKQGFKGNLTAAQIINQILSIPPKAPKGFEPMTELTNVVF